MKRFLELVPDPFNPSTQRLNSVIDSDRDIEGEYGMTLILDIDRFTIPAGLPDGDWMDLVGGGLAEILTFQDGICSIRSDITVRQKDMGPDDGIAYYYKIGDGPEQYAMGKLRTYFRGLNQKGQRGARGSAGKS